MDRDDFDMKEVFRDVDLEDAIQEYNYRNGVDLDLVDGIELTRRNHFKSKRRV